MSSKDKGEQEGITNMLKPKKKGDKKKVNWRLRIGVAAVFLIVFVILISQGTDSSKLIFCERVNGVEPVGEGTVFSPGEITVVVKSGKAFGVTELNVTIYEIEGSIERVDERVTLEVDAGWNFYAFPVSLTKKGTYKVGVTKPDGEKIAEGKVYIK